MWCSAHRDTSLRTPRLRRRWMGVRRATAGTASRARAWVPCPSPTTRARRAVRRRATASATCLLPRDSRPLHRQDSHRLIRLACRQDSHRAGHQLCLALSHRCSRRRSRLLSLRDGLRACRAASRRAYLAPSRLANLHRSHLANLRPCLARSLPPSHRCRHRCLQPSVS